MFYMQFSSVFGALAALTGTVICTTEWFGDLRAHMNPPKFPPFHDIIYDEPDCPFGLESVAIPEFVYFGEMIATKFVREHSQCLQFCLETPKCKAVNFFESMERKNPDVGFCELLVEGQYDNPRLMRPFKRATYHEKIHCRAEDEEEKQPFTFDDSEGKGLFVGSGSDNRGKNMTATTNKPLENGQHEAQTAGRTMMSNDQRRSHHHQHHEQKTTVERQPKNDGQGKEDGGGRGGIIMSMDQQQRHEQVAAPKGEMPKEKAVQQMPTAESPPSNGLILQRLVERIRELKEQFKS